MLCAYSCALVARRFPCRSDRQLSVMGRQTGVQSVADPSDISSPGVGEYFFLKKANSLEREYQDAENELAAAREEENLRKEQLALAEQLIHQIREMSGHYEYKTNPSQGAVTVPQANQVGYISECTPP